MENIQKAKQAVEKAGQITTVTDFFEKQKDLIRKALPATITPDRMVSLFTMAIKSSPELMNCSQASLIAAVIQTIQLGFLPIPSTGHVYYVPFKNRKKNGKYIKYIKEVQFILGYKGMIELINRSREAAILAAECVRENDFFDYSFGLNPVLVHKPAKEERGEVIGAYAIAKNKIVGEKLFVYLAKDEIEKVRAASKAGQSEYSPWQKWYEEMAKKTAIKRLAKLLPLSIDVQKQLSTDETIKTEIGPDMTVVKDETVWDEEKEPELLTETEADARAAEIPSDKELEKPVQGPEPTRGTITNPQIKAIQTMAAKIWGPEGKESAIAGEVGAFGCESLTQLSIEQASEIIEKYNRVLSKQQEKDHEVA